MFLMQCVCGHYPKLLADLPKSHRSPGSLPVVSGIQGIPGTPGENLWDPKDPIGPRESFGLARWLDAVQTTFRSFLDRVSRSCLDSPQKKSGLLFWLIQGIAFIQVMRRIQVSGLIQILGLIQPEIMGQSSVVGAILSIQGGAILSSRGNPR